MSHYKYAILGGGMSAASAVHGIRDLDQNNEIGLFSLEMDPPYDRPPLSKGLWKNTPEEKIWRKLGEGVEVYLGRAITMVDPVAKKLTDDTGKHHTFDRLLLATGVRPRRLPFASDRIIYFRTLSDYRRLRDLAERCDRFAVIGGGFIGSEVAAALATNGKKVVMIVRGETIGDQLFPRNLGVYINSFYRWNGVEVRTRESVVAVEPYRGRLRLTTLNGQTARDYTVDAVVAGIGVEPNVEVARAAGIDVDDGIVVDDFLRTNRPNIFAAGDVACFPDRTLQRYRRVEHEDNANRMGRLAGRNMAGAMERYREMPFFYSDLFDLGYEAVGETVARHEIVQNWIEPNRKGVVYYLQKKRLRGMLMWNLWGKVDTARRMIAKGDFDEQDSMKNMRVKEADGENQGLEDTLNA